MRTWSLVLLGIGACGPIYPDQQPARPPASDPSHASGAAPAGPPGGGADPWAASQPGGQPDDPYGAAGPAGPGDPYAAPAPAPPGRGPAARPRPAPAAPAPPAPAPTKASGLPADAQALLDAHNRVRAQHCAPALQWSPKLAQAAQQWVSTLRDQGCKFGHSGGRYGENLAAGTSGALDGKSVTEMWYDEIKQYAFPDGGFSMQTGHFTQVVWRETTQMGCAHTSCKGMDIWVCEYDPPGNVQGMYRQNVLRAGCK
jgi:uncharacterized protein YkwD